MDRLLVMDEPYIQDGFIRITEEPGLSTELNPEVVKAHLAEVERWWG
jgi:L-alanine-DL-glutamate epimerase-like enolase superfamily enzyme